MESPRERKSSPIGRCPRLPDDFTPERQLENEEIRYDEPDVDDTDYIEDEGE